MPAPEEKTPPKVLQGLVEVVTYHDEKSLYTVLRVTPDSGYDAPSGSSLFVAERQTAVGRLAEPVEGMRLRLTGKWTEHRSHGIQFEFESAVPLAPQDEEGLVRYLASKVFEGVGETLAKRIVAKLGAETLDSIRDHANALSGIRGLSDAVALKLRETVRSQLGAHQARAFLRGIGLGPLQSQAVIAKFGIECEGLLREDPYMLSRVPTLGFATADKVARSLDFTDDDPRRLRAGLLHGLRKGADDGHTMLPVNDLLERTEELLDRPAPRAAFEDALDQLESDREVIIERELTSEDDPLVYLPHLRTSERGLAENLRTLLTDEVVPLAEPDALAQAEEAAGIELHETQRKAVLALLSAPVGLLTGGPGVGKTTIVRLVAALAEDAGCKVLLASPTGRAAKRLAEATGRPASTIHRLLGYNPGTEGFDHNAEKPLKAGLVIIDEISMLDIVLAHHLVKAVATPTRLIFVGDPNQLPSVGPGNVLADLLASERIATARLTQIFRQDENSRIVKNAHHILSGQLPEWPDKGDTSSDFYFFPADDPTSTAERVVDVVTKRIPENFGHEWQSDVQVIAPMYRGPCGVDALNERLRDALGYGGHEITRGSRTWRTGDRVIHTRNDYEKEVFNGDMGHITQVTAEGTVTVKYPEQDVVYQGGEISDLRPAFAITVHRSQGGEFPAVVVPLVTQHYMMLQRNLLYTAITRARQLVVIVGSQRALEMAIDNVDTGMRESALRDRLVLSE